MRLSRSVAATISAAALVLAGCAGAHDRPPVGAWLTPIFAARYVAIVTPVNGDILRLSASLHALPPTVTDGQLARLVAPTVVDLKRTRGRLLAVEWPGRAERDVRTLAGGVLAFAGDLHALGRLDPSNAADLVGRLGTDDQHMLAEAGLVRADLGLRSNLAPGGATD